MFGGLLASAIANMEGIRSYSSWRLLFIVEGVASIMIGINAYFFAADFPADIHCLGSEETEFVIAKTEKRSASPITIRNIVSFFGDVKNIVALLVYFGKYHILSPIILSLLNFTYSRYRPNIRYVPLSI